MCVSIFVSFHKVRFQLPICTLPSIGGSYKH